MIPSIPLSGSDIFGFDGDGICDNPNSTSGLPGANCTGNTTDTSVCINGPNGSNTAACYSGPDSYFTGIDTTTYDTGTVNFQGGGLAAGTSTFFSLEGVITGSSLIVPGLVVVTCAHRHHHGRCR